MGKGPDCEEMRTRRDRHLYLKPEKRSIRRLAGVRFARCAVIVFCLVDSCAGVHAQQVSLGVIAGASLTQDFQNASLAPGASAGPEGLLVPELTVYSTPKRYVVKRALHS